MTLSKQNLLFPTNTILGGVSLTSNVYYLMLPGMMSCDLRAIGVAFKRFEPVQASSGYPSWPVDEDDRRKRTILPTERDRAAASPGGED
jgi:hypothetical protein